MGGRGEEEGKGEKREKREKMKGVNVVQVQVQVHFERMRGPLCISEPGISQNRPRGQWLTQPESREDNG